MNFNEKTKIVGRLEIIKVDSRTGNEEVLFDEKNVITEGLGRSITQMMTTKCDPKSECGLAPLSNPIA